MQVYIYKDLGQDFSLEIKGFWDSTISNVITARADVRGFKCVIVSFLVPFVHTGQEGASDGSLKTFLDLADSQRGEEVDSNSSISSSEDSASSSASSDRSNDTDSANSDSDVESSPKKAPKRSTKQGEKRGREPDGSKTALRKAAQAESIKSSSSGKRRCPP